MDTIGFEHYLVADDFTRYDIVPGRPSASPRYLQVELTDRCNLRCRTCPRSWLESTGDVLRLSDFEVLIEDLPDLEHVSFVGLGEVLLLRSFPDYVRAAHRRGIRTSCNSNGVVIPHRLRPALEAGLDKVQISIDAQDESLLAEIRSGIHRQVLENAFIFALHAASEFDATVSAAITVGSANLHDLPHLLTYLDRIGVRNATIECLHHWGQDRRLDPQALLALPVDEIAQVMTRALRIASEAQMNVECFDFRELARRLDEPAGHCPWPWDSMVVTNSGEVTPCCVQLIPDDHNRLGNVLRESARSIWMGERFETLRKSFFDGPPWVGCVDCVYRAEFGRS